MRLIDANKVLEQIDKYIAKEDKNKPLLTALCYDIEDMANLKPVDAIPISFLKDKIALNESWGCYGYAKGLQSAIDEWEKQNECGRTV